MGEQQSSLDIGEDSFNMEHDVESLIRVASFINFMGRVGEMEENSKS